MEKDILDAYIKRVKKENRKRMTLYFRKTHKTNNEETTSI